MKNIDFEFIKNRVSEVDYKKVGSKIWFYAKKTTKWASISFLVFILIAFVTIWSLKWINPSFTAFTLQEDWEELGRKDIALPKIG